MFLGAQVSSSFVDSQKPWNITYGTGAVSGSIVTDSINVAGLALAGHRFGVAQVESVDFSDNSVPFDGLMGLAKSVCAFPLISHHSPCNDNTPIDALPTEHPHTCRIPGEERSHQ